MGKLKEKFYRDAVEEYSKRLQRFCKLEITELPETRLPEDPSPAQVRQAVIKGVITETQYKEITGEA